MQPDHDKHEYESFEAHLPSAHDGHEDAGSHGTEMGWLVSYADMMTLLFGLFVLLFTLMKKGDGAMENTMKSVSSQYFSSATSTPPPTGTPPPAASTPKPSPDVAMVKEIETLKKENSQLSGAITKEQKAASESSAESEKASAKIKSLEAKIEALQVKIKSVQTPRSPASADASAASSEAAAQAQATIEAQQKQIDDLKSDVKSASQASQKYVAVLASWSSEQHDVDLYVTTPSKKTFNYKNRKIAGQPGRFEIDSRFGPGIEMWKAENFEPGDYSVSIVLYSQNGNPAPAPIQLSLITNSQTYKSETISLKTVGDKKLVRFNLDLSGKVTVYP